MLSILPVPERYGHIMKNRSKRVVAFILMACLVLFINGSGLGRGTGSSDAAESASPPAGTHGAEPPSSPDAEKPPVITDTPPEEKPVTQTETKLVPYKGTVEHLFFHELIAYPESAFRGDYQQKGYDDYMVTVSEYIKILNSLYEKNYIIVNMNDVWSEYTDENGVVRMRANTLMLPEGKKPIILSFDDISFYEYMTSYGFLRKLIIGDDGEIWAYGHDPDGNEIITQDLEAITLLDKFVAEHPDFSLNGTKGCIALTGYEGILGYRTQTDKDDTSAEFEENRQRERMLVRPVVKRLKETGWYFASHSWGHINLNQASLDTVKADTERWLDEVGSLVGETSLFIYPFGSRLDGDDVNQTGPAFKYCHSVGFRIFASVGIESFSKVKTDISAVICDRMHADGTTLRYSRERYMKFYDAVDIFDPLRPAEYGNSW